MLSLVTFRRRVRTLCWWSEQTRVYSVCYQPVGVWLWAGMLGCWPSQKMNLRRRNFRLRCRYSVGFVLLCSWIIGHCLSQEFWISLEGILLRFAGLLRVLESPCKAWNNFSRLSRPGKCLKTDMVLESPWICVWRSLKVLEFDFLKRGQEARESYFSSYQKRSVA